MRYEPIYVITPAIAASLMRIEAAREAIGHLPITPGVLATLRETARLQSTHYSTMIEGNRLTQEEVSTVVAKRSGLRPKQRDEREVLGYYRAMEQVEQFAVAPGGVTEEQIRMLHGSVMSAGRGKAKPSIYRDRQNVITDSRSRRIVYMPPEAKDVPKLMKALVAWIGASEVEGIPGPIRAGIAHYQFATIHPYYDGNGRTARLLTTLILHRGGYDLKGLYSLEEYYARDLRGYYAALTVGPSHNYYMGRAESDITPWVDYFCRGVAESFENVKRRAVEAAQQGAADFSPLLRQLDPRQRRVLELFRGSATITSRDIEALFGISQRGARKVLANWVAKGFVTIVDPAKKSRRYGLARTFRGMVE
jgi:Fic family protein